MEIKGGGRKEKARKGKVEGEKNVAFLSLRRKNVW